MSPMWTTNFELSVARWGPIWPDSKQRNDDIIITGKKSDRETTRTNTLERCHHRFTVISHNVTEACS